ncbi:GspE/PulE family protein [Uliginosibacterium sp. 31-16]|uniref:GspE/PulE family protein n=1 Tax=Uliginosibacterium sp. 31-16 TaxID=3068315 RepID=UPI00273D6330|nr:GspE/PulE family protein [Uliginosibacterium sp. 31-16]MDP5238568.1 GspE/PulE family protein [Uliginosibacterium sp. 31-16]
MAENQDGMVIDHQEDDVEVHGQLLGEYLCQRGVLSAMQLQYALQKQKVEGQKLGGLLVRHGLASEYQVASFLSAQRGIPLQDLEKCAPPQAEVLGLFNRDLCLSHGFLPLRRADGLLDVMLGDGEPAVVSDLVMRRTGMRSRLLQGEFTRVAQAVRQHFYFSQNPIEELIGREVRRLGDDPDRAYSPEKLLDHLLHLAVRERATDIHFAPAERSLHVLLRIDGVLRPMFALPQALNRLLSFVKLSAEMDVSEQRLPQDGSFNAVVLETGLTIRVSTLVSEHGERMVLRLLPERNELGGLERLGFLPRDLRVLEKAFAKPSGMVLITGPTGSGKSTTLHAALRMQSLIERNVLTIEDPVEYQVPGACQTEVNRRAGYEFGSAMRFFLRHDPDVMLVGEIRDAETAQAAIDAASTGHLVLSTLHVGSVFGVVPRLRLLGVDSESIAENMIVVVNQRLLRQVCPFCRTECEATTAERNFLGADARDVLVHGAGCAQCGGSGYYGRLPVYEMIQISRLLADAIANAEPRRVVRQLASDEGFAPILEMARWRVLQGQTTVDEVLRVVGDAAT